MHNMLLPFKGLKDSRSFLREGMKKGRELLAGRVQGHMSPLAPRERDGSVQLLALGCS